MMWAIKKMFPLDHPLRLSYHKLRAVIANIYYGFPSSDMTIIWVTWTNWKTTTCNIIASWLIENGEDVFMFSTVNIIMWKQNFVNNTKMTSPDVFELQRLLKLAKDKGIKTAIIETASHGIKMNRVWWINYDTVVLTNITQDHLDLHRTMDDYVNTKLEIFKKLMIYKRKTWVKKTWVINIDSKYSNLFLSETFDSLYTYWKDYNANIQITNVESNKVNSKITVRIWATNYLVETKLKWDFNAYNICAAIWVFMSIWIEIEKILTFIGKVSWVPWRLEEVENDLDLNIFIDYAHTTDALENVLTTLERIKWKWEIITVFWATWDRDKTKRQSMWEIVSKISNTVILTQDDDYSEKTRDIVKDILPWIWKKEWEKFWIITEREEAIRTAIIWAKAWDIILIAWKWDEHLMITNEWPVEWHDKTKVLEILKWIDDNKII